MTQNDPSFQWTSQRRRAVEFVADDRLTDEGIAREIGIARVTLVRWKRHPEFLAAVNAHVERLAAAIEAEGIANRQNRIDAYNRRWECLERIRAERAASPEMESIPGGATGFIVKRLKKVNVVSKPDPENEGAPVMVREEYWEAAVDVALLKEWRELEKQAAQDMGQWTEKREVSGPDGGPIPIVEIEVARTTRARSAGADESRS